jgi:hypothetical protein
LEKIRTSCRGVKSFELDGLVGPCRCIPIASVS